MVVIIFRAKVLFFLQIRKFFSKNVYIYVENLTEKARALAYINIFL